MYDCREHSNNELSLVVFNDEYLYNRRNRLTQDELIDLGLKFTDIQWEILREDINEDDE